MSATIMSQSSIPVFSAVRHQPVAGKSAAVRRRYVRQLAILSVAGVLLALAYVWIRVQVIETGYEVSRIRKETNELKEQKEILEAQVGALKSPVRIETIAIEKFGMRLPNSDEIVIVDPKRK